MRKRRLIDAHNVMHKIGEIAARLSSNHSDAFSHFITLVDRNCRKEGIGATVIFDGPRVNFNHPGGNVTVLFSHPHTADDHIRAVIHKKGARGRWIVVTDDLEILDDCRKSGVATQRSSDFIGLIRKDTGTGQKFSAIPDPGDNPDIKVRAEEVDEMLRLFNKERRTDEM